MVEIFGQDIAQIVADALASAGGLQAGTLTKESPGVRDPDDPTAATDPVLSTHSFQGFFSLKEVRIADTLVAESIPVLTIVGKSVTPMAVPQVGDKAELSSITFELVRLIERDPAEALYEFEAR